MLDRKEYTLNDGTKVPIYTLEKASSSFDIAHDLCKENLLPLWGSVLVGEQSAGRGQMRKHWHSPKGNIYAALRLPLDAPFDSTAAAPALGAVIVESLAEILVDEDISFYLKWTNDIIIKHKDIFYKTVGILLEEKNDNLIAGIGINLTQYPELEPQNINKALPAIGLANIINNPNLNIDTLWTRLVQNIHLWYINNTQKNNSNKQLTTKERNAFASQSFLTEAWYVLANKNLAFKNCPVVITNPLLAENEICDADTSTGENKTSYTGILRGISHDVASAGGLIVDTDVGRRIFLGGTLRQG